MRMKKSTKKRDILVWLGIFVSVLLFAKCHRLLKTNLKSCNGARDWINGVLLLLTGRRSGPGSRCIGTAFRYIDGILTFVTFLATVRERSRSRWRIQGGMKRHLNVPVEWNGWIKDSTKVDKCDRSLHNGSQKLLVPPFPRKKTYLDILPEALHWRRNLIDVDPSRGGRRRSNRHRSRLPSGDCVRCCVGTKNVDDRYTWTIPARLSLMIHHVIITKNKKENEKG